MRTPAHDRHERAPPGPVPDARLRDRHRQHHVVAGGRGAEPRGPAGQPGGHRGPADPPTGEHLGPARPAPRELGGRRRHQPADLPDPAFTHVIGYSSLRFGSTGIERAYEDLLVGQTDPNPIRDIVNDILDRQPMPRDLSLTIDQRLQDFAAAELGGDAGAVVALDPNTGAVLALVSTPTFDATAISGDPATAQEAMDALRNDPAEPLLGRARQGLYVPGSIMKVFTGSSGLDAGVITPSTTFPDQPAQESRRLPRRRIPDPRARPRRHPAGPVGAVRGAPGVEQHLLRPRRPGARRR